MTNQIQIFHEGETWETLHIRRKWQTWEISLCHDGDVEISCEGTDGTTTLFLSQDELKRVISFLETKVKDQ